MTLIAPHEAPTTTAPAVEARGVHVRLGASHILRGVDLTVARGEVVALLGANGSGKSTLVRTLVGVLPASEGDVRLLGSPLRPPRGSRGAARQGRERIAWDKVGYVPQRVGAGGGIPSTAQEVVASGLLHAHRLRLPRGWRTEVRSALDQVGLGDRAHDPTNELSGGQQQRVLIARALVRKPELLVLDEPVAGVDRPSQEAFAATMSGLVTDGLTVLVVLHELGELAPLVSRCVVLRHGRVVHDGAAPRPHGAHDAVGHDHVHPHEPAPAATAPGLSDGPFPGSEARA